MNFGQKLEKLRLRDGKNFVELGKAVGMSADTISGYEKNNNQNIAVQNIKKIADYFKVSIDYLLNDDDCTTEIIDSGSECINDVSDMLALLEELKCKIYKTKEIKFDNRKIDEYNKILLIDGIDVLLNIMKANIK